MLRIWLPGMYTFLQDLAVLWSYCIKYDLLLLIDHEGFPMHLLEPQWICLNQENIPKYRKYWFQFRKQINTGLNIDG